MKKITFVFIAYMIIDFSYGQSTGIRLKDPNFQLNVVSFNYKKWNKVDPKTQTNFHTKSLAFVSPYKHIDQLGFVCKWELKMDERIKNPIRFRLGSYDYVNKLEGK